MRSLKSLGVEAASYAYDALLSPVLLSKLPPDLQLIVSRKVSDSDLDMDALLTMFEEELTARERANPQFPDKAMKDSITMLLLYSLDLETPSFKTGPHCSYCQQSHPSTSCTSVTAPADRKHILMTSGWCFNCLRWGHITRNCKSSSRCQKCKKKHHISIYEDGQNQLPNLPPLVDPV